MTVITKSVLAEAILTIEKMDNPQRETLADEIHSHQPQLLTSVLAQQNLGATWGQIEVLLNILLVSFQAMKASGYDWPTITESMQERCFARFAGRVRFIEGLAERHKDETISESVANHCEKWLLAFVFDELRSNDLLAIDTDAKKILVLTALGMVECIAEAGCTSG